MRCICVGLVLLCGLVIQFMFNLQSALHLGTLLIIVTTVCVQCFSVWELRCFYAWIPEKDVQLTSIFVFIVTFLSFLMLFMGVGAVFLVADIKLLMFWHESIIVVAAMLLVPLATTICTLAIMASDQEEYVAGRYYGTWNIESRPWVHVAFNFCSLAVGITGFVFFAILARTVDSLMFSVLYVLALVSFVSADEWLRRNSKVSFFWSKM